MMKCKNVACFCPRSAATVRGLLSCQPQLLQWGSQTALHAPLCHFECVSLSPSLRLPVSLPGFRHRGPRRWWVSQMELKCLVPQLSPMQIALSTESITANSQQSVLFDAFFLFFYHDVMICGPAASLVNVSDMSSHVSLLLFAAGLPTLLHGLLQYLQYSHTVRFSVLLSCCFEATCWVKNTCELHWFCETVQHRQYK